MKLKITIFAIALLLFGAYVSAYTVDETEQVLVTRFDKVNRSATTPGSWLLKQPGDTDQNNRKP